MSDSVTVNVEVTEAPFGVKGSITVDDSVFDLGSQEFHDGAAQEINRLSRQLHELAIAEYDRRHARTD